MANTLDPAFFSSPSTQYQRHHPIRYLETNDENTRPSSSGAVIPNRRARRLRPNRSGSTRQQTLRDASNRINEMTSLQYNRSSAHDWPLKPSLEHPHSFPNREMCSSIMPPRVESECYYPNPPLTPKSFCSSQSSRTLISPRLSVQKVEEPIIITPTTRRRLAVEGLRKAASDAALRKLGLHLNNSSNGWNNANNTHTLEESEVTTRIASAETGSVGEKHQQVQEAAYSPRQYTPKPLLLPSKLARASSIRSPSNGPRPSLLLRQRTISYHSSTQNPNVVRNLNYEHYQPISGLQENNGECSRKEEVQVQIQSKCDIGSLQEAINSQSIFTEEITKRNMMISQMKNREEVEIEEEQQPEQGQEQEQEEEEDDNSKSWTARMTTKKVIRWALAGPDRKRLEASTGSPRKIGSWLKTGFPERMMGLGLNFNQRTEDNNNNNNNNNVRSTTPETEPNDDQNSHNPNYQFNKQSVPVGIGVFALPEKKSRQDLWSSLKNLVYSSSPSNNLLDWSNLIPPQLK